MSSNTPPPGYYSGPGGSSQVPNKSFNAWKLADPNNITGVGNKGSAPPTDFGAAASAQGQSSQQATQQQTQANRPNQQNGFGGVKWTQDENGNWTQNASLNPQLGGALGSLQQQAQTNAQTGPQSIADASNRAIQSNYGQATSRLDPQWNLRQEQMQTQLANQGLSPGSAAYNQSMQQFGMDRNDAYSSAMNNAIGMGNQTQQVQQAGLMSPYQQMGALQGYQNNMPSFATAGNYGGTQYLPAAEAAAGMVAGTNQQNQQNGSDTTAGIGSMVGAIMSDERVKDHVQRLPVEVEPGIPLATYRYKHAPEKGHMLGVIAQDVEKVRPDAVQTNEAGIKSVDYSKLKPFGIK